MRFAYLEAKMALIEIIRKYRILLAAKTKVCVIRISNNMEIITYVYIIIEDQQLPEIYQSIKYLEANFKFYLTSLRHHSSQ